MALTAYPPQRLTPGDALTIPPTGASDPTMIRWRRVSGPSMPWTYDLAGNLTVSAPKTLPRGGTALFRAEEGWLPFPPPGLATGAERVVYFGGGTFTVDETVRFEDHRTTKVVPTAGYDGMQVTVSATAGKTYLFTANVQAAVSSPGYNVQVTVVWKNASSGTISTVTGTAVTPPNGTWANVTYQGTAPANTVSANVYLQHTAASTNPYWVGYFGGYDTAGLTIRDVTIDVLPARSTVLTASGERATGPTAPAYVRVDEGNGGYNPIGGPVIGGVGWLSHREGPASSTLELYRDIASLGRFKAIVGEPDMPGTGSVQRAELSPGGAAYLPFTRGTTYWWAFSFRMTGLPPSQAGGWMNICQIHQSPDGGDTEGPQPFGFYWQQSGRIVVDRRYDPNTTTTSNSYQTATTQVAAALTTDVWHNVVIRARMDNGATSTGSLGFWFDGTTVVDVNNVPFGYNDTAQNYPKFGIYRGLGSGVNVCEYANMEIGTTDLTARITSPLPIP